MVSIFLSHSSNDKFIVRKLAEKLTEHGIKVWIDEAEIKVGDSLIDKISKGISNCDYLAVFLSHNSVNSNWVQRELQMAMSREILGTKVILPLLIEKCEIPIFLRDKLYADFTNPDQFEFALSQLLEAIGVEPPESKVQKEDRRDIPLVEKHTKSLERFKGSVPPAAQSKLELFEDIKIIGVNKDKTYNPDKNKELYNVYFTLSQRPTKEWVEIFDAERRFPRHGMWRKAWIEDHYIIVHCCLDEIKAYHQHDIVEDVKNSNLKFREYLQNLEIKKQRKIESEFTEKNKLNEFLDNLNF